MNPYMAYYWIEPDGYRVYKSGRRDKAPKDAIEISRHDSAYAARRAKDAARGKWLWDTTEHVHFVQRRVNAGRWPIESTTCADIVIAWCKRVAPQIDPPIPASVARLAHNTVPLDFAAAQANGWLDGYFGTIPRDIDFRECRRFIAYAAREGHEIKLTVIER